MDLVCDAPPKIETAPMGVGAEFQAEDWCTDGFDLAHAMVLMASFHGGEGRQPRLRSSPGGGG